MASLIDTARKIWTNLAGSGGARTHTRYAYLGDHTALVATHADLRLLIDTRDRGSAPQLALVGRWEADVERVLVRLIRPGMRIVEVGANFGYHTLTMARAVGPTGHVDAFEANPRMYELLNDSILINDCQSIVTTHPNAALDRAGPVEFQIHPRFAGSGNVVVPGYLDAACQHIEVVGVRLDDVLDAGPPVDLLRMDAEGSEPLVLRGGEGLLRRSPGMRIVMEFSTIMMRTRVDVPEFIAWLATFSFKAWRIESSGALAGVALADLPELAHCEIVLSRDVPPGAR